MRRASRGPDAHRGRPVPAGSGRGAGGGDGRRPARARRAGRWPAAAGPGRRRAGRRDSRSGRARGKRDAGCGQRGALRRWSARGDRAAGRGCAQAPRRGGGAVSGSVATVGTFDGIHRGHQAVLDDVVRRARARGLVSLLVTFDPHPLEVVNPSAAPRLLTLPDEKRVQAAVERGAGRGRTIGVPTINLTPPDPRKLLPPDGVYAVWVEVGKRETGNGKRYGGVMNQGPRPTFGVTARALEAHLFDFAGDLYGETVTVEWVRRLRDVQTFPSRQALVDQIERDAAAARSILNG